MDKNLAVTIVLFCALLFSLITLCTVIVTLCQAVKPVTYFLRHKTDAVSLTLQSAVKHHYPPVILLIPRKHPEVTGDVVQALDRT